MDNRPNPVVFISYSYDNKIHAEKVLELSNKLRSEGIDCILDQYEESPSEGWPRWMDKNIANADFVLMICTGTYYERVMGLEEKGVGLGVRWEGNLIYQHLYDSGAQSNKFIPVLFSGSSQEDIPIPIRGVTHYKTDLEEEYEKLYLRLRGASTTKPPLGALRPLPKKEKKGLFVTGFIDVDLWNNAGWNGIAYAFDRENKEPPTMAILFKDKDNAKRIFEAWQRRLGKYDEYNELRISIVEGDIPGEDQGYSVHIGANIDNVIKRANKEGIDFSDDLFLIVSRIHRMNPMPESKSLSHFKDTYKMFGSYCLIPAIAKGDDYNDIELLPEYRILKRNIEFRDVKDIKSKDDFDSVLLAKYRDKKDT